ncbi:conserved hypothetical protein [Xenorhabdus bovienii str. puntauvense]|uniref:Uncharacterized protein n=1 Tax=Xenorhabdus bovienii str. puntauvense TaxID=1398201 RepID=A0A077MZE4_XENBV|nr:conserved hypothetical protein [Xenorhabdus bovienii str. puntauvense]
MAEAKENGKLKLYRVANLTAQAINFRIGAFTSTLDASKVDGKQAWQVTFTLREHLSVSDAMPGRAALFRPRNRQSREPELQRKNRNS